MTQTPDFDISHHWVLRARPQDLTEIVLDTSCYDKWCSRVLMRCEVVSRGRDDGLGLRIRVHTKGWLPHSFLFDAEIVDLVAHKSMTVRVTGDFEGISYLEAGRIEDGACHVSLRWITRVEHPVVRRFVPLTRFILARNHIWATNWVRRMIQSELDRRRAGIAKIAAPPPTFGKFLAWARPLHKKRAREMGWSPGNFGKRHD